MKKYTLALASVLALSATPVFAVSKNNCKGLPDHAALKTVLNNAVVTETSGFGNEMWATLINRDGVVCAIVFSGEDRDVLWPGSRVAATQKAFSI